MSWFSPSFSGAMVNAQSCRHGGALVGLAPPNKARSPPKWKYETLKVNEIFVKFECHAPPART